jgi:hypothetical protein
MSDLNPNLAQSAPNDRASNDRTSPDSAAGRSKSSREPGYVPRRKRKLDERRQTEICAAISLGCSRNAAARLVGCSATAIVRLAERDADFGERLHRAELQREIGPLRNIQLASQKNWRAAAWVLERLSPQNYAARKPAVLTPQQVSSVIAELTELFGRHILDLDARNQLRDEVGALLKKLNEQAEKSSERLNG